MRGSQGLGLNASLGLVRRVHLLKDYFIIISTHVMIREIIPAGNRRFDGVL